MSTETRTPVTPGEDYVTAETRASARPLAPPLPARLSARLLGALSLGSAVASFVVAASGSRPLGPLLALVAVGAAAADFALARRGGGTISGAGATGLVGGLVALVIGLPVAALLEDRLVDRAEGSIGTIDRGRPADAPEARLLVPATVAASTTAPTAADATGEIVDYEPGNTVDGDLSTAWRTYGSGVGEVLVFTFSGPVHLDRIAVVPGYAKVADDGAELFWHYRRVLVAAIEFDDGKRVVVELDEDPAGTVLEVAVTTARVTLVIQQTTTAPPGDFTAISEIAFVGTPA